MRQIGVAVIRSGLVSEETITELQRWGLPVETIPEGATVIDSPDRIVGIIQDALESGEHVSLRDTELDIFKQWLNPANQREGKLVLFDHDAKASFKVIYCLSVLGEFVIPWRSESVSELLLNEKSHLQVTDEGSEKIFFSDIREVFIGDTKAFIVCAPQRTT